ncbi:MAG TPA: ABC transporter permease subunit [Bacilli bacterium]|jgi:NitT/TauT family transport system permease protein|nr:ABC transporter permease subunit [Bacilli bacterium]
MMNKTKAFFQKHGAVIYTVLGIGFVFLLWWLTSLIVKATVLPTFPGPEDAIPLFFTLFGEATTWLAVGGTLLRLAISFAIAFLLGSLMGIIAGVNKGFAHFMRPLVITLRTLPTAAVILILIVLLRPLFAPIIIVFLIIFPISYESMATGIKNVNREVREAAKIDGATRLQSIIRIKIPLSLPYVLLGIVSSLGLGMKISIMSEIIAGSNRISGLGRLIHLAYIEADMTRIVAISIFAIILIGLIDLGMYFAKKKLKGR